MTRESVEWAKKVHLHNGPDDMIALRGGLAAVRAQLDAANERARVMAGDVVRLAQENAAQAAIIWKLNRTNDELRLQMRLAAREGGGLLTLTDRGDAGDGYGVEE